MSETSNAILEAKRRARDYWDIDGLPALLAGATPFLLGVFWLYTGKDSVWDILWVWFVLSCLFDGKVEWLKNRITYPRTGYVAPPKETPYSKRDPYTTISIIKEPVEPVAPIVGRASRKAIGILHFPLLFLVLVFVDSRWIVCLACLASAFMFWHRNEDDPPWFEIAGSVIAGLVTLPVDNSHRFGVFLLVFGATGMVKGATLLTRYLRQHPAPQA
jgi:hypothetical protein